MNLTFQLKKSHLIVLHLTHRVELPQFSRDDGFAKGEIVYKGKAKKGRCF